MRHVYCPSCRTVKPAGAFSWDVLSGRERPRQCLVCASSADIDVDPRQKGNTHA